MSSHQLPLEFSTLGMINRVLTRAGYRISAAEVDAKDVSEAATYRKRCSQATALRSRFSA